MSAIFDFSSLLTALLLLICTTTYLRELRPTIFDTGTTPLLSSTTTTTTTGGTTTDPTGSNNNNEMQDSNYNNNGSNNNNNRLLSHTKRHGISGFLWKLSRIGERLSPYVSAGCAIMAINILFFR